MLSAVLTRPIEMATTCPALALADSDRPSEDKPASENRPLDLALAASTSSEDKRPVHNQPEETLAQDKHKAEEPEAGLDDYSRRTYSGYPSDATCESCAEYLDEQFEVVQKVQVPKEAAISGIIAACSIPPHPPLHPMAGAAIIGAGGMYCCTTGIG